MPEYTPEEAELRETILDWMELATVDQVLTAVKAHDKGVAARAWDEGFDAGEKDAWDVDISNEKHVCTRNPYRSGSEGDNR